MARARPAVSTGPYAALGVLSGTVLPGGTGRSRLRYEARRESVRQSWMRFENVQRSVVTRFVLRCGGLPAGDTVRSEPHVLCTPIPANESRQRGPILALFYWLGHAAAEYPTASFVCKADDDVFLHLPDIEAHLRSIPAVAAHSAYYGSFNYYHVREILPMPPTVERSERPHKYTFHAFGPTHHWSQHVARKEQGFYRHCANLTASSPGITCAGPFPFANGPFFALGRGLAVAVARSSGVAAEVERLRRLPRGHKVVVEDIWLGAALWRHVGGAVRVNLLSIAPLWNRVFMDTDGFRVHRRHVGG